MQVHFDMEMAGAVLEDMQEIVQPTTKEDILTDFSGIKWVPEFIQDRSSQMILKGGRRGGKTSAISAKIIYTNLFINPDHTDSFVFYASKTVEHAKTLLWNKLRILSERYSSCSDWNMDAESAGVIRTPRGGIKLLGFNDVDSISKAFGQPFKLFIIDECQEIRSDILQTAVRDAGSWGTLDTAGSVVLSGNPSSRKYHFFSQSWLKGECKKYFTNMQMNPFLKDEEKENFLNEQRKIRGEVKGEESAEFRRMAYGEIIFDNTNTVFSFSGENYYKDAPPREELEIVIGVDLGWRANDAICVLGWHKTKEGEKGKIYLLEELQMKQKSMEFTALKIDEICEKYNSNLVVMDTGGLAIKSLPDLQSRYSHRSWIPAEKKEKVARIKLLQTEIKANRFKIKENSIFEKDCAMIEWQEHQEKLNDRLFHSDILDAILYASRYCYTNLNEEKKETDFTENWSDYKKSLISEDAKRDDWGVDENADW